MKLRIHLLVFFFVDENRERVQELFDYDVQRKRMLEEEEQISAEEIDSELTDHSLNFDENIEIST